MLHTCPRPLKMLAVLIYRSGPSELYRGTYGLVLMADSHSFTTTKQLPEAVNVTAPSIQGAFGCDREGGCSSNGLNYLQERPPRASHPILHEVIVSVHVLEHTMAVAVR